MRSKFSFTQTSTGVVPLGLQLKVSSSKTGFLYSIHWGVEFHGRLKYRLHMQVVWTQWTACGAGESKDPRNLAKLGTLGALLSWTEGARWPYLTVTAFMQNSNSSDGKLWGFPYGPDRPRQFLWSCSPFALDSTGALRQWQGDLQMFESRGREKRWIVGWYAGAGLGEFHPDPFGETTGQGQAQNRRKALCQKGQQEQTSRWMWIDEIDLNWPCNHIWDYLSAINLIPSR